MMRRGVAPLAAALLLAGGLTACGQDDGSGVQQLDNEDGATGTGATGTGATGTGATGTGATGTGGTGTGATGTGATGS
jgi:hypothetical protein